MFAGGQKKLKKQKSKNIRRVLHYKNIFFPKQQSPFSEVVPRSYSKKKLFLKIYQNSQENTCARIFFVADKVAGWTSTKSVVLLILQKFSEQLLYITPENGYFSLPCSIQRQIPDNTSVTEMNYKYKKKSTLIYMLKK